MSFANRRRVVQLRRALRRRGAAPKPVESAETAPIYTAAPAEPAVASGSAQKARGTAASLDRTGSRSRPEGPPVPIGILTAARRTEPALLLTAAVVLAIFAGNWEEVGLPGALGPERWLFVAGLGLIALRAPSIRTRPRFRMQFVHWLMAASLVYAACTAIAAGTLTNRGAFFQYLQGFGVLPYAVLALAPFAFGTGRQRNFFLAGLVVCGGYLGLVALFETIHAYGLIVPGYIADPSVGPRFGRARGPFLEPVTDGFALYATGTAAVLAAHLWRGRAARCAAGAVALLCVVGLFFTLQRSVWVAGVVATLATAVIVPRLRRYIPAIVAGMVIAVVIPVLTVPGLLDAARGREQTADTVYERKNLNHAALNMIEARPLLGFGWGRFRDRSTPYFELNSDYPLNGFPTPMHNAFLLYPVELGLIGATLWLLVLVVGIGGPIVRRGPPSAQHWRVALLANTIFFVVVANFVVPQAFASYMLFLWAAVVVAASTPAKNRRGAK